MCKSDCSKKITGLMEEYDEPEGCDDEDPEEHMYDDLESEEDEKGNMTKSSGFEERWKDKVRLIPESLDSNYVYYDPNEEENRRNTKETLSKTMGNQPKLNSSQSPSLPSPQKTMVKDPSLFGEADYSEYEESSSEETEEGQTEDEVSDGKTRLLSSYFPYFSFTLGLMYNMNLPSCRNNHNYPSLCNFRREQ